MVGDAPEFALYNGTLTLRRTDWGRPRFSKPHSVLAASTRIPVGPAVEAMIEDGDVINAARLRTGDMAVALSRDGELLLAIGAIEDALGCLGIVVESDPRLDEPEWPALARRLARRDTALVWIDPILSGRDRLRIELERIPAHVRSVVIAVRTDEYEDSRQVAARQRSLAPHRFAIEQVVVPAKFCTREEWVTYLNRLPPGRPDDVFVTFEIGSRRLDLREGECRTAPPWHLFVDGAFEWGNPGRFAQLGVARMDLVDADLLIASTTLIAARVVPRRLRLASG
jgi:hypothetical protein